MTARRCETCAELVGGGRPDACLGMLDDVLFACCGHGPNDEHVGMGYVRVRVHSDFWRAFTVWIRKIHAARGRLERHALFLWPYPNPVQADLVPLDGLSVHPPEIGIFVPMPELDEVARPACDATKAACRCGLDFGHAPPHVCDRLDENDGLVCGGSWSTGEDGAVTVYAWPGSTRYLRDPDLPPLPFREPPPRPRLPIEWLSPLRELG